MYTIFAPFKRALVGAVAVAALCLFLASSSTAQAGRGARAAPGAQTPKVKTTPEASNVHVLLVADTYDVQRNAAGKIVGGIGQSVGQDVRAFQKLLIMVQTTSPQLRGRIRVTVLTGNNATPAKIRAYYRDLKCGPNDNLVFYLSSHGGMRRGAESAEEAHMLTVCSRLRADGSMSRAEVRRLVQGKQPRGIILITDVCSGFPGAKPGPGPDARVRRSAPGTAPNAVTVRNLFFRTPRLVNITAARDGTMAQASHQGRSFGGARSAFTVALLHVLCDRERNFATWAQLFPALDMETFKASGRLHQPRHFGLHEHRGGIAVWQQGRYLLVRNRTADDLTIYVQGADGVTRNWSFAPGQSGYLAIADERIVAREVLIWARAEGKRWDARRTEPLVLVPTPYQSPTIGTFAYAFDP